MQLLPRIVVNISTTHHYHLPAKPTPKILDRMHYVCLYKVTSNWFIMMNDSSSLDSAIVPVQLYITAYGMSAFRLVDDCSAHSCALGDAERRHAILAYDPFLAAMERVGF